MKLSTIKYVFHEAINEVYTKTPGYDSHFHFYNDCMSYVGQVRARFLVTSENDSMLLEKTGILPS